MGRQVIKQPDGKYCIFSSYTDTLIFVDATRQEIIDFHVEEAGSEAKRQVTRILDKIDSGNDAYRVFMMTYEEAVKRNEEIMQYEKEFERRKNE